MLTDADGAVARAFRVNGPPVVIIVDDKGIIRGRVALGGEDAALVASEVISSLRPAPLPVTPAARRSPI